MRKSVVGFTVLFLMAIAVGGCSSKKKSGEFDDEGLGAVTDEGTAGSLGEYQRTGKVGGSEGGPLGDIYFGYDSSDLSEEAMSTLRKNQEYLQDHTSARVEIEGHCDDRGTIEYNLALGAKRARAARDYLVALGVGADRLTTISYGEELPLCYDHTDTCWQKNRRVHFVVRGQ